MEQGQISTKIAGIDVGKRRLDAAVYGSAETMRAANTAAGVSELIAWLKAREVGRVGLEVRLFARLKRLKAKNDRIDAQLIAAATAQVDGVKAAADPRLADLAERMTAYEQIADQLAELRTFMEHVTLKDVARLLKTQLAGLERLKARLMADLLQRLTAHADLTARLQLLMSLPGVGATVAASLVVRMPELGALARGQAASLLGVAPFDRDSGQWKGRRMIGGGRSRPRRMLYMAALSAKRFDPDLKVFADRLAQAGKAPKLILTAVMRKLIEAANTVLARGQPWLKHAQP